MFDYCTEVDINISMAHGYEDERFDKPVNEKFHCGICYNVYRDPVMCRHNQHIFCRGCITRHLMNSQTCPLCKDRLNVETLSEPPRILTECLSELRIHCDFVERGCEQFVQLQDLERHVESCGYAPVLCPNEGCRLEVNIRDLMLHEFMECENRKLKCHNCERLTKDVDKLKHGVTIMGQNMKAMEKKLDATYQNMYSAVQVKLDSFKEDLDAKVDSIDNTLRSLKRRYNYIEDHMKDIRNVMKLLPKKWKEETDDDEDASQSSDSSSSCSPASQRTSYFSPSVSRSSH